MAETDTLTIGDYVRSKTHDGIAMWFVAHPLTDCEHAQYGEYCDCEPERDTSMAIVRMVGDDRDIWVSMDDITPIKASEFCRDCGQLGCHSNRYE